MLKKMDPLFAQWLVEGQEQLAGKKDSFIDERKEGKLSLLS